jgi:L-gulonate 5-dehydrogenase
MVSIVVREPRALEVESANVPEPKADEVVVKVRRAGICGSDVHILHGSNPFAVYPRVIGHEFAGEVFSVGAAITGIKVGDRVVVDPVLSCGDCYPCRIGRSNVCANLQVMGVHCDGGFRDYVAVPASVKPYVAKAPARLLPIWFELSEACGGPSVLRRLVANLKK